MILRQLGTEEDVLRERQQTITDVLPQRHPAGQGAPAEDARAEDDRIETARNERRHRGDQTRRVLVVGVDHDHDVRPLFEREPVAGLLISAITGVLFVLMHFHAFEVAGHLHLDRALHGERGQAVDL